MSLKANTPAWRTPGANLPRYGSFGSDTSPVNLYLLGEKYNIEVAETDGVLLRRYNGAKSNRHGYGFPLSGTRFDLEKILRILENDARERGESLRFCLCDEKQKNTLDCFRRLEWKSFDGDSDYIFNRESLSRLSGKHLHGQRNHVNHFMKSYTTVEYFPLTEKNLPDALNVAQTWLSERDEDDAVAKEWFSIQKAAEHWDELNMFGGIIYADGEAAAFEMLSELSGRCADCHFRKATAKFATDGAYAVINNRCAAAQETVGYEYINEEEDMGMSGLKRAKESYHPAFKLKKFYGEVC